MGSLLAASGQIAFLKPELPDVSYFGNDGQ
jgi:hypothetical protein